MSEYAKRFDVLDGWRGLSILFVLSTHLLPLGPKSWQLNLTTGPLGMALFFTLSGFLITNFLLHKSCVTDFLIRRFVRIVPLAWLYVAVALISIQATSDVWAAHLLFYANWPPMQIVPGLTSHLWSLCVEMQFYVGIALLVLFLRQRGLLLIPLLCIGVTLLRVYDGVHVAINTYYRVDEILAGSILALAYNRKLGFGIPEILKKSNPYLVMLLLVISCHPASGPLNYLRPYLAAMLVGCTLFNHETALARSLTNKPLVYVATISYALYVIHPILNHSTWLGSGEGWEKYIKRPLLFAVLFLLAHISTFHFEHRCIAIGKRISARLTGSGKVATNSA